MDWTQIALAVIGLAPKLAPLFFSGSAKNPRGWKQRKSEEIIRGSVDGLRSHQINLLRELHVTARHLGLDDADTDRLVADVTALIASRKPAAKTENGEAEPRFKKKVPQAKGPTEFPPKTEGGN